MIDSMVRSFPFSRKKKKTKKNKKKTRKKKMSQGEVLAKEFDGFMRTDGSSFAQGEVFSTDLEGPFFLLLLFLVFLVTRNIPHPKQEGRAFFFFF